MAIGSRSGLISIDDLIRLKADEGQNVEYDAFGNMINQEGRAKNLELLGGSYQPKSAPSTKIDNPTYGFTKLAEMAKAGKFAPANEENVAPVPDMHTNEAFAYYTNLRDKLKKEIEETKADIAFREKVKKIKARMDPLWKAARIQAIFTGDMTPIFNLVNRYDQLEKAERDEAYRNKALQQTADLAKMNKEAEDKSKADANIRAAQSSRALLQNAYDEFMAGKSSRTNQIQGRNNLFRAFQDFKDKAEAAGKSPEEFFTDTTFLPNVQLELDEALSAMKEDTDTREAKAKQKKKEEETDRQARDEIKRINSMPRGTEKVNAISQFFINYPNYIGNLDKDGKFAPQKKESKKK